MTEQTIIVLILLVVGVLVLRHVFLHNRTGCPKCKGTGKCRSSMFSSRYMKCPRCGGKGEVRAVFGSKL